MKVHALGEIALRVHDLDGMQRFYEDVVGLELMRRFPHSAFFRIADGHAGHTQILALFDRSSQPDYAGLAANRSPIDHFAFSIDLADFVDEKRRLEELGLVIQTATHAWVRWRSLYFSDPEGNRVEFVCFDGSVL